MRTASWRNEICDEARRLYEELTSLVDEFNAGGASIQLQCGAHDLLCAVSDPVASMFIRVDIVGFPREYVLRVNWWQGWHQLPSPQNPTPGGQRRFNRSTHKAVEVGAPQPPPGRVGVVGRRGPPRRLAAAPPRGASLAKPPPMLRR